jgi:hypothetical protein
MSSTTIHAVWPGEKVEDLEELRNSWGSAPPVWDAIAMRYLGMAEHECFLRIEELWPVYDRPDMPAHQRAVLMMTYDRAMVMREHYKRAAADIRAWLVDFPQEPGCANHWPRIADLFDSEPDCPAIGFRMTSVTESLFWGQWNDEREDYDPPDWSQFWSVYEVADEYASAATEGAA